MEQNYYITLYIILYFIYLDEYFSRHTDFSPEQPSNLYAFILSYVTIDYMLAHWLRN